jgi:hypothetical protein
MQHFLRRRAVNTPKEIQMFRKLLTSVVAATGLLAATTSFAESWVQGQVTEIVILSPGNGTDAIYVKGTFPTGCAENGFLLLSTDAHYKETYAAMLAAKLSGTTIKFLNVYCLPNGYARGNGYSIAG